MVAFLLKLARGWINHSLRKSLNSLLYPLTLQFYFPFVLKAGKTGHWVCWYMYNKG